jgi:hypothetical protein
VSLQLSAAASHEQDIEHPTQCCDNCINAAQLHVKGDFQQGISAQDSSWRHISTTHIGAHGHIQGRDGNKQCPTYSL